ncbi:MAG TPA: RNA-binding protein [Beijerinckiaceae bacterium]|nr:RNA-binding protein [Beijerinckiaceae bacterium]
MTEFYLPRREPERTCIVSRAVRAPDEMIRFVVGPDGEVVPDLKHRLPGRGVWVSAEANAVAEAVRRRLFGRAFKAEVRVAPDLAEQIEAMLRRDLHQALSLANKAGAVVSGFVKVETAIREGGVVALLHAAEAAEDGRRKLVAALRKRFGETIYRIPVIAELTGEELDLALGRSHVIHAGLVAGAGSGGFLARWRKLCTYRGLAVDEPGLQGERGDPTYHNPQEPERT